MALYLSPLSFSITHSSTFATYGTVLHIDSVEYTLDGRSLISTVGEMRFRVVSSRVTDGYNTARIEFITDTIVSRQEDIGKQQCHDKCMDQNGVLLHSVILFMLCSSQVAKFSLWLVSLTEGYQD